MAARLADEQARVRLHAYGVGRGVDKEELLRIIAGVSATGGAAKERVDAEERWVGPTGGWVIHVKWAASCRARALLSRDDAALTPHVALPQAHVRPSATLRDGSAPSLFGAPSLSVSTACRASSQPPPARPSTHTHPPARAPTHPPSHPSPLTLCPLPCSYLSLMVLDEAPW